MAKQSLIPAEELDGLPEQDFPSNKPQKIDDSNIPDMPQEEEEEGDEQPPEKPEKEPKEEARIPQRRFDRVYAEREAFKQQVEESNKRIDKLADMLEKSLTNSQQKEVARTTPDKWKKILGEDNPLTDQFYALLDEEMTSREERAAQRALEQFSERQSQESSQITQRVGVLEDEHESFADEVGIDTSTPQGDEEMAKILEIQDEMTPVGQDRKYSQPLIPINVAYEIYKARNATAINPQKQRKLQASNIIASGRGDVNSPRTPSKGRPDPGGWRKFF